MADLSEGWTRNRAIAFIEALGPPQVSLTKITAERTSSEDAPTTSYNHSISFVIEESRLFYKHDVEAIPIAQDGETAIASISASVVAAFDLAEDYSEVDTKYVEHFGETSLMLITTPFLREVVSSTAARLGILGVNMPLVVARIDPERAVPPTELPAASSAP